MTLFAFTEDHQELLINFKRRMNHRLSVNPNLRYSEEEKAMAVYLTDNGISVRNLAEETGISKASIAMWRSQSIMGVLQKYIPPPRRLMVVENHSDTIPKSMLTVPENIQNDVVSERVVICEFLLPSGIIIKMNRDLVNVDFVCIIEKGVKIAGTYH